MPSTSTSWADGSCADGRDRSWAGTPLRWGLWRDRGNRVVKPKSRRGPGRPRKSEQGSESSREHLLLVAGKLFGEKGYEGTSTADIAEAAGLTPPAIFYYFDSKEGLFRELANESVDEPLSHLTSVLATDASPAAKLYDQIVFQVTHNLNSPFTLAAVADDTARLASNGGFDEYYEKARSYTHGIRQLLQEGIAAGQFRANDDFLGAMAILGMANWALRWFRGEGRLSADEVAHGFAEFALSSLLAKPKSLAKVRNEAENIEARPTA